MTEHNAAKPQILIIRLGALGDMILSSGCFKAIRAQHPDAHITLMTTSPFDKMMSSCPYFDAIVVDTRPSFKKPYHTKQWKQTLAILRRKYTMVYDLQTSKRSGWYLRMLPFPRPQRSGIVRGCSARHHTPDRKKLHTLDRQRQQLGIAGITYVPSPDISWLTSDISRFNLPDHYALIVAGGSAHRPEKRWTSDGYAKLAMYLSQEGITPVFIGTSAESGVIGVITHAMGNTPYINLCNQTSFADIAELGRNATISIGNDTGPMHIIAATGGKSMILFSHASDPSLCAPRGDHVRILRRPSLEHLAVKDVITALTERNFLAAPAQPILLQQA